MSTARPVTATGATFPGNVLPRSRSAEDLSQERLKTTESDTVLIFIEYVRSKQEKTPTRRTADLDAALEAESRARRERGGGGGAKGGEERRKGRESLRRLHSEPNGPQRSSGGSVTAESTREVPVRRCEEAHARPTALVLDRPPSNKDERRHRASLAAAKRSLSSASSGSDSAITPAPNSEITSSEAATGLGSSAATPAVTIPDPPLCAGLEDGGADFASSSYPPLTSLHRLPNVSSAPAIAAPAVLAGAPVSQTHYCTAQQPLTPQMTRAAVTRDSKWRRHNHARIIANKLKIFGDEISSKHEEELQREFAQMITSNLTPQDVIHIFSQQLHQMMLGLSWKTIGKVFHLSYHLIEMLHFLMGPSSAEVADSREWAEFSDLWDFTIGSVTRWISSHGGWRAFPADSTIFPTVSPDQPSCPATPSLQRVRSRLLSLSESGEFEFIDGEGQPLSADTISTTSSELTPSDEKEEDQMGSSVDLLHDDPLSGSASEPYLTSPHHLPPNITPVSVSPSCSANHTHKNHTPSSSLSPRKRPKEKTPKSKPKKPVTSSSSSSATAVYNGTSSTVAFSNGISQPPPPLAPHSPQLPPSSSSSSSSSTRDSKPPSHAATNAAGRNRKLTKKKGGPNKDRPTSYTAVSSEATGRKGKGKETTEGRSNSEEVSPGMVRRNSAGSGGGGEGRRRRSTSSSSSNSTLNGLMIGVGGAAVAYAAVSALMRR